MEELTTMNNHEAQALTTKLKKSACYNGRLRWGGDGMG